MLNAHFPYVKIVLYIKPSGEGAALLALLRRFDVLVGGEMVHNHGDFFPVEHPGKPRLFKLVDGDGGGDVVAQDHTEFCPDELARPDFRQPRMGRQDFLRHCHSHGIHPFLIKAAAG